METMNDYQIRTTLGKGSFATVWLVQRKCDRQLYALKKIDFRNLTEKDKLNALNEIRVLASINNPHIVGFKSAFYDSQEDCLCVVMEYAQMGDLAHKIQNQKAINQYLEEKEIWRIVYHMAKALKTLHCNNILHRDIKAANIFEAKNRVYKLADFNICKIVKEESGLAETQTGTPFYASPQIWENTKYDFKSDIWSLGILAYELSALTLPFPADDLKQLYTKIQKGQFERIPEHYTDELHNLIVQMLSADPKVRPTAEQVIARCLMNHASIIRNAPIRIFSKKVPLLETIFLPREMNKLNMMLPPCKYIDAEHNKQNEPDTVRNRTRTLLTASTKMRSRGSSIRITQKELIENNVSQKQNYPLVQSKMSNNPSIVSNSSVMKNSSSIVGGSIVGGSNKTQRLANIQGKRRPLRLPSVRNYLKV